uniref:Uncharacterized protein n=1 Tax=Meloidogyne javanica TaxID=6303 RepID=A0A915M878_MELJA
MLTTVLNTNLNNSTTIITTTNSSLIAWLKRWPKEFVRFLISPPSISDAMPDSGPWKYDYENSVLHFGEHEYVVFYFWKMGSGLVVFKKYIQLFLLRLGMSPTLLDTFMLKLLILG